MRLKALQVSSISHLLLFPFSFLIPFFSSLTKSLPPPHLLYEIPSLFFPIFHLFISVKKFPFPLFSHILILSFLPSKPPFLSVLFCFFLFLFSFFCCSLFPSHSCSHLFLFSSPVFFLPFHFSSPVFQLVPLIPPSPAF